MMRSLRNHLVGWPSGWPAMRGRDADNTKNTMADSQPQLQARLEGLFLGAAIGDAASQPIEWIYDVTKLAEVVKGDPPEFLPQSHCPFYNLATGLNGCYFEQAVVVATSLVEKQGFDLVDLQDRLFSHFGPGTLSCFFIY